MLLCMIQKREYKKKFSIGEKTEAISFTVCQRAGDDRAVVLSAMSLVLHVLCPCYAKKGPQTDSTCSTESS